MTIDLHKVAKDWDWLTDLRQFRLLDVSPFGDLLLIDSTDAVSLLDINLGALEPATEAGTDPVFLFPVAFDDVIASGYRRSGLILSKGTCYGYKRQLVAGATMEAENVYVASLTEYVSFMGNCHDQIKDVVDGETVTLKVVNQKVIQ